MSDLDRSRELIQSALELFDQADDIERRARDGEEVIINGQKLRGEQLTPFVEQARDSAALPLLTSAAINLERIARTLEAGIGPNAVAGSLDAFITADLAAELSRRIREDSDG